MSGDRGVDAELEASRHELAQLRRELDETNRGLIALYAELESARQVEARLAAMVQSSDDAMYSLTGDMVIDSWNPGAERLLGHAAAVMVGRRIEALVPEELRPELDAALDRLRAGERAVSFDSWRRRADGSPIEVAVTVSAMRDADDRPAGYAIVLRDLTERRRAEAELAAARAAREVLDARDRIARDIHDGAIQGIFAVGMRLQATASMSADQVVRERLQSVVAQLDVVIADLRRHVFGLAPPSASGLGQALRGVAGEAADQRAMRVNVDVDEDVASRLEGHAEELLNVVREALSNASRHGRAGTAWVSLAEEDGRAVLEIADDGAGFDVAGVRPGGHGLSNFRWRAEQLGGEARITSAPGQGTTIRISLPL